MGATEELATDDPHLECLGVPLPAASDLTLGALLRQAISMWLRRAWRPLARKGLRV